MGRVSRENIKKTVYYLKRNGVRNTWYAAKECMEQAKAEPYRYEAPAEQELERQRRESASYRTVISIVVPAYHPVAAYLCELIDSVLAQTYPHWELVLADVSSDDTVERVTEAYSDERIRYIPLKENAGIAENTNRALAYATGDYVGLLDHDDVLTQDALYEMAAAIRQGELSGVSLKMLYSDEDKCNGDGTEYYEPNFKEKFNLDLLLSNNYICHFLVMERSLLSELKLRADYDGAQDYDLVLRAVERLMDREEQLGHVPRVLYHWRCHTGSTAENPRSKQYAYEAGCRALQDFADRQGWHARAEHLRHLGFYRLSYLPKREALKESAVFQSRRDIGAVGGRVMRKGRIIGGGMTEEGSCPYEGLPAAYSGYLHRAALTQDVEALDIRCIRVRKECVPLFEEITGVSYKESEALQVFDTSLLPRGTDYREMSLRFGKALCEAGYRMLYQPELTVKWR